MNYTICIPLIFSILALISLNQDNSLYNITFSQEEEIFTENGHECIRYEEDEDFEKENAERMIIITCSYPTNLTSIYNALQNEQVIKIEENNTQKTWILNSGIFIEKGSTFIIDSEDTKWLKIIAEDEGAVNPIIVHGNLVVDSVKISSWDQEKNDYIKFEFDILPDREREHTGIDAVPRPYIRVDDETTGTTNITNSEIAYLGYECGGGCSGISYYGSNGTSLIKNNEIHHNRFGFYSVGVGGMILENNHVHHNFMYGFDPHTATYDMIIRNNTVHDHGAMGIICSLDCYNITIEDNEVYNSAGSGIMFSRNMYDSVARNNDVHDEVKCIFVSQSHNNEVYNNKITNCESQGIYLFHNSIENKVYNNTLVNATKGIEESDDSQGNMIYSNNIL